MQGSKGLFKRVEEELDRYLDRYEEAEEVYGESEDEDDGGEGDGDVVDLLADIFDGMDD